MALDMFLDALLSKHEATSSTVEIVQDNARLSRNLQNDNRTSSRNSGKNRLRSRSTSPKSTTTNTTKLPNMKKSSTQRPCRWSSCDDLQKKAQKQSQSQQQCRWTGDSIVKSQNNMTFAISRPERRGSAHGTQPRLKSSVSDPTLLWQPQRRESLRDIFGNNKNGSANAGWNNLPIIHHEDEDDDCFNSSSDELVHDRFDTHKKNISNTKNILLHENSELDSLLTFYDTHVAKRKDNKNDHTLNRLLVNEPLQLRSTTTTSTTSSSSRTSTTAPTCAVPPRFPIRMPSDHDVNTTEDPAEEVKLHEQPKHDQQERQLSEDSFLATTSLSMFSGQPTMTTTSRRKRTTTTNPMKPFMTTGTKSSSIRNALGSLAPSSTSKGGRGKGKRNPSSSRSRSRTSKTSSSCGKLSGLSFT